MLSEIQELCEIISPRMFRKPYGELDFMRSFKTLEQSEGYRCAREASIIRQEALARARKAGRTYDCMAWPELLVYCEAVLQEKGYLREPGDDSA